MMRKLLLIIVAIASVSLHAAPSLTQYTAVRLQRANEMLQEDKLAEAITLLEKLKPSGAFDQASVARMLGVVYWQNGQTDKAIAKIDYAVTSGLLQDEQAWVTQKMLADLLLSEQQYQEALPHYYQLSQSVPENQKEDLLWLRIAQAHYQIAEWQPVIPAIDKYLGFEPEERVAPLTLKLGAQLQQKHWKSSIPTLEELITLEPEKVSWWQQLVGVQLTLKREQQALSTLALAKLQGVELTQQDRRTLAQLYARFGVPERAAVEISELENATTDTKLLVEQATYWQNAKEWEQAIDTWTLAANQDNQYQWNVAQLLMQQHRYEEALPVLDRVEGHKQDVLLAKTRAHYKLGDYDSALLMAKRAEALESSKQANSWIKYLKQRREMAQPS